MEDVAARAGVSRALVSIVFREAPGASEQTRARVRAAAAELGYRPDHRARLLGRRARSGSIGVGFGVGLTFHADLVEALYASAAEVGYDMVLSGVTPGRPEREAVEALLSYRCEALVLLGPTMPGRELSALAEQVPTVVVARRLQAAGIDVVRTDDVRGAGMAVDHLLALGHRRIAHVDGGSAPGAVERRAGFRAGMRAAGCDPSVIVRGGLTEVDGMRAVEALLHSDAAFTAIAVFNDRCAVGVMHALRAAGRRVPQDVSIVGFDDDRLAALPLVDLTTIRQDRAELAARALARVVDRLREPSPAAGPGRESVVTPQLVVRGTTRPPVTV
jgi:DNA-binding LacI/PurR family transcriptional regulator